MRRLTKSRPSPAMVIASIALFVALGGASYAALAVNSVGSKQLKKNAVTTKKIKNDAVTGEKVRNGSLTKDDFGANQLPAGPAGATGKTGPQGPEGPAGTAKAFARIRADGTLETEAGENEVKGITQSMIQKNPGAPAAEATGPGIYCLGGLGFQVRSAIVSLDNSDSLPPLPEVVGGSTNHIASVATFKGPDLGRCDAEHGQVRVAITRVDQTNPPTLADHGFFIWLEG